MDKKPKYFFEVKPEDGNRRVLGDRSYLFVIATLMAEKTKGAISIHTGETSKGDKRWGGSPDLIDKARSLTDVEILAKGVHTTQKEVDEYLQRGADYVLTVDFIPSRNADKCLIELSDLEVLRRAPKDLKYVWNSRDIWALLNGTKPQKRPSFAQVRQELLKISPALWLCQASNIRTIHDVHFSADAVLVGTNLETFSRSLFLADILP